MLSRCPVEFGWNCNASKAIVFYGYLGFLADAILEACPQPGVDVARNIDGCCSDEIIPSEMSVSVLCLVMVAGNSYHEVRV